MKTLSHTVSDADDGRMIKRILRVNMRLSHRQLSAIKAGGGMLLDGVPVHANAVVLAGQVVTARIPEDEESSVAPDNKPVDILYEDEDLLIVNKSAPLACQSSPRQPDNTLENRMAHYFRALPGYTFRPVNRLDKGTSGLMVVAKHAHAQMLLSAQLHTDAFVREYLAVVCGRPPLDEGTVDLPIAKEEGPTIRRVVEPDGRPSVTHYAVERSGNGLSLVRLRLETGRTHQIRVHMAALGCPVLGDFLYGEEDARLPRRFALHSHRLAFIHPLTGARMAFETPLPPELAVIAEGIPMRADFAN